MNVIELKQYILDDVDNTIPKILEKMNYYNYTNRRYDFRFSKEIDGSGTSIRINKDTLKVQSFADNWIGDIITLVQKIMLCDFKEAISIICESLNISKNINFTKKEIPFGGYFEGLKCRNINQSENLPIYNIDVLDDYLNIPNMRFFKDGISLDTQKKFDIRYDLETNRIIIPWRNLEGDIIGLIGRINDDADVLGFAKYFPIIPFSKSQALYGLHENYNNMLKKGIVLVAEAEKSTLQADSIGVNNCVSVGSHNLSIFQIQLIYSLYPKKIILVYDEDIEEDFLKEESKKIKSNSVFTRCEVGYIYDKEKKYLEQDSKASPFDKGKDILRKLLSECLYWID